MEARWMSRDCFNGPAAQKKKISFHSFSFWSIKKKKKKCLEIFAVLSPSQHWQVPPFLVFFFALLLLPTFRGRLVAPHKAEFRYCSGSSCTVV